MIGDGNPFGEACPFIVAGFAGASSISSSTGASLLGAGVKLWSDPLGELFMRFFFARPLTGKTAPFDCVIPFAEICDCGVAFGKKPAMEVWFLELDVDFLSVEGGAGVPLGFLEEPAMITDGRTSYRIFTKVRA